MISEGPAPGPFEALREENARLRTELESRKAERFTALLFGQLPYPRAMVCLDSDRILLANQACCARFGRKAGELDDRSARELDYLAELEGWRNLGHHEVVDLEGPFVFPDGTRGSLRTRFSGMASGGLRIALAHFLHPEPAPLDAGPVSERKYRQIIESMDLGMIEVDTEGRITKVYDKFCAMSGYAPEDLLGKDGKDVLITEASRERMRERERERQEGVSSVYEIELIRKDGKRLWTLLSGVPLQDERGQPAGSIGIHLDITERKEMEEQLRRAKEQAEASNRLREQFLARVSHELRTPLNALLGYGRLLERTALDAQQAEFVRAQEMATERLIRLVNDLLDLSRLHAGKLTLHDSPFPVDGLIEHLERSCRMAAEDKGLAFRVERSPDLPEHFRGDLQRILQILTNLVDNATKYTDRGAVWVSLDRPHPASGPSAEGLRVTVSDTGRGIPEDALERIFQLFEQGDEADQRYGSGLGLTICRDLVHQMGGRLRVRSRPGEGSTFTVSIPLGTAEPSIRGPRKEEAPMASPRLRGRRVLVAEDDDMNARLIQRLLESWGLVAIRCQDGQEALDQLERLPFHAVLMDIRMPGMDGLEATRRLRERHGDELPVIGITADAHSAGHRVPWWEAGMDACLTKPLEEGQLLAWLHERLAGEGAEQAERAPAGPSAEPREDRPSAEGPRPAEGAGQPGALPETPADPFPELERLCAGDRGLYRDMLGILLTEVPLQRERLGAGLAAGDLETVRFAAHRLKNQLRVMAGPDAVGLLAGLQEWDSQSDPRPLLDALDALLSDLLPRARRWSEAHHIGE